MKTLESAINKNQNSQFTTLTQGIDIDHFLFQEEVAVQKAWVSGLLKINLITLKEADNLSSGLDSFHEEVKKGSYQWKIENEDIHMSIERYLTERFEQTGKKIHLGRSRNDLVATTTKLYLANRCKEISEIATTLSRAILDLAEKDIDIIVPAFTHSQSAQPVRMSHVWNFHALNFYYDANKFSDCYADLMEVMPLGSGAIAGTHLDIDLNSIAIQLGFRKGPINSIHETSDRDWLIEVSQKISIFSLHLSRLCDDIIFLSSSPVKLIELPPEWSSGSSMMPNKRNPDFFEVIRAKAKKLITLNAEVLTLNLGIGSGYSSDYHEQKRSIVEGVQKIQTISNALKNAISLVNVNKIQACKLLNRGHLLATDIANDLVANGVPFREAYNQVARMVRDAEINSKQIENNGKTFEASVESRNNTGGTSRRRVQECILFLRESILKHSI